MGVAEITVAIPLLLNVFFYFLSIFSSACFIFSMLFHPVSTL